MNELDFIRRLSLSNEYICPKCGASTKIPVQTPGQMDLFAPRCYSCNSEMVEKPKI